MFLKVIGLPRPQARPRVFQRGSKIITHSPKSDWFHLVYGEALAKRPPKPLDGPLHLCVEFYFPRPKAAKGTWKISRPDCDNALKAVQDAMTQAQWWTDDARICHVETSKRYVADGQEPGADIIVEEL